LIPYVKLMWHVFFCSEDSWSNYLAACCID
jgi:hypothetical protein